MGRHQRRKRSKTAAVMRVMPASQVVGDQQRGSGQVDRGGRPGQGGWR